MAAKDPFPSLQKSSLLLTSLDLSRCRTNLASLTSVISSKYKTNNGQHRKINNIYIILRSLIHDVNPNGS